MSTHTHTHTHTLVGFYGLRGLSIGVMVFILYKLYVLLPYTYPTPKLSPHRKLCAFILSQKKTNSVWFISLLNYGDTENVLMNHLPPVIPVIPMSFYKFVSSNHKNTHTCARAHTHTHTQNVYWCYTEFNFDSVIFISNTIFRGWDFIHRQLIRFWLLLVVVLFIKVIFN